MSLLPITPVHMDHVTVDVPVNVTSDVPTEQPVIVNVHKLAFDRVLLSLKRSSSLIKHLH